MAVLTVVSAPDGAAVPLVAAAAGGDQVASGADAGGWELPVVLVVVNDAVAAINVTVEGNVTAVPASGGTALIPIRGAAAYGDLVDVAYSAVTSVTVGAASLARGLK